MNSDVIRDKISENPFGGHYQDKYRRLVCANGLISLFFLCTLAFLAGCSGGSASVASSWDSGSPFEGIPLWEVTGRVFDATSRLPIDKAEVCVMVRCDTTSREGFFTIAKLVFESYTLNIHKSGYKDFETVIDRPSKGNRLIRDTYLTPATH